MERNLNRSMAISKCLYRALYYDLGEMTGLCVEEYVHLAQNGRNLDGIVMRVLEEAGECGSKSFSLSVGEVVWAAAASLCLCCICEFAIATEYAYCELVSARAFDVCLCYG